MKWVKVYPNLLRCPYCNNVVSIDGVMNYCPYCGRYMGDEENVGPCSWDVK